MKSLCASKGFTVQRCPTLQTEAAYLAFSLRYLVLEWCSMDYTNEHIQRFIEAKGTMMIIIFIRDFLHLLQRGVDRPLVSYSNNFGVLSARGVELLTHRMLHMGTNSLSLELQIMGSPIMILQYFTGALTPMSTSYHTKLVNKLNTSAEPAAALMKASATRTADDFGLQINIVILKWFVISFPLLGPAMGKNVATQKKFNVNLVA
ncbi:hypothetical protein BJ742DRAFT_733714 [Cladochytrium replicatum]|nr:hypothetical protein BJ742DRAFT_733714 [Cladochytrium replicatum]